MKQMTVREAAKAMGVTIRRVMTLIAENRLPGSTKNEYGFWQIPAASVRAKQKGAARSSRYKAFTREGDSNDQQ